MKFALTIGVKANSYVRERLSYTDAPRTQLYRSSGGQVYGLQKSCIGNDHRL
jgi:hypothetical protein